MIKPNVRSLPRGSGIATVLRASSLALLGFVACSPQPTHRQGGGGLRYVEDGDPAVRLDGTGAVTEPGDNPSQRSKLSALDLSPRLVAADYFGDLCPPGGVSVQSATDGSALSLAFSESLRVENGEQIEASCQIRLSLKVPEGSSFGNVYAFGSVYADATAGEASLSIDYSFAGQSDRQSAAQTLSSGEQAFVLYQVMDRVWSPSCDQSVELVDLVLDVKARVSGQASVTLTAIDLGLSYIDGARFMRCSDRALIQPAPSEESEPCAGRPRHPCASGLECDVFDAPVEQDELLTGVCVRRDEKPEDMPKDGPCNGLRQTGCQPGLVCRYTSRARAAVKVWSAGTAPAQLLGRCTPERGFEGNKCAGHPAIECAPGHFCSPLSRSQCRAWTGELGSACEKGIATCNEGLECQSERCRLAVLPEGDACDGPDDRRCGNLQVCDPERRVCVPDPNRGKLGRRCREDRSCDEGLACYQGVCRNASPGGSIACNVNADCSVGQYCPASKICRAAMSGDPGDECTSAMDCKLGLRCVNNRCVGRSESLVAP